MGIRTFIKFLDDTLSYGLDRLGLRWQSNDPNTAGCHKFLIDEYGEAVLLYRNANEESLRERVRQFTTKFFLDPENLCSFIQWVATDLYNSSTLFSATFHYCVLVLDLAVFCCRYGRMDLLDSAIHWTMGWVYGSCNLGSVFEERDSKRWDELQAEGIRIMLKQRNAEVYRRLVHLINSRKRKLLRSYKREARRTGANR